MSAPLLLGNKQTLDALMGDVTALPHPSMFPFKPHDNAGEMYDYLMAPNPFVVEGAGLERSCRWWHPLWPPTTPTATATIGRGSTGTDRFGTRRG